MTQPPRVRFAPSPTGSLHLGNARTALVNWLYARQGHGTLVLRIEDTDAARHREHAEAEILRDLRWLGIEWDEGVERGGEYGPYRQSARLDRYRECLQRLLQTGAAYYCFEPAPSLQAARERARTRGMQFVPEGRDLDPAEAVRRVQAGEPAAIRFRVPEREVRFDDLLRGHTGVAAGQVDDFVIGRSDGTPTYQLAVTVDDHDMRISHVIRGQDHLSNTPKQLLLYEAFGWSPPRFAHLPLVLGPDRSRLSKRHGAVSVAQMRQRGVLPEALVNALLLLGWAPPDEQEVLTVPDLVRHWRLGDVSGANAVFDTDKLEWLNQQHLQRIAPSELLARAEPYLAAADLHIGTEADVRRWWSDLLELLRPGIRLLSSLPRALEPIFTPRSVPIRVDSDQRAALQRFARASNEGSLREPEAFRRVARHIAEQTGVKGRRLFHPLRLAVTGCDAGPELARLLPLIERGARLPLEPPVPSVARRLEGLVDGAA